MDHVQQLAQPEHRKPYRRPVVVYDARLEAQAGSPLGGGFDPLNLDGTGK